MSAIKSPVYNDIICAALALGRAKKLYSSDPAVNSKTLDLLVTAYVVSDYGESTFSVPELLEFNGYSKTNKLVLYDNIRSAINEGYVAETDSSPCYTSKKIKTFIITGKGMSLLNNYAGTINDLMIQANPRLDFSGLHSW